MLTLADDEPDEGDHYQDFLEILSFLFGRKKGPEVAATLAREMRSFRGLLHALPQSQESAVKTRQTIERRLRQVIARTERIASTVGRDSMMSEPAIVVSVAPADLAHASALSQVARTLDAPDIIEYWKSAPYLLNFMHHYSMKQLLMDQAAVPSATLRDAIQAARPAMLDHDDIDAYAPLEPGNGRMRAVMDDIFGQHLEQNLWIPAAMPYYGAPRADVPLTKALIFSSWSVVPDAVAALLSYEWARARRTDPGLGVNCIEI
jgi:Sec-independent protein translocase protein TatA